MSKPLKDKILEQFGPCTPKYILSHAETEILQYMEMLEDVFSLFQANSERDTSRSIMALDKYLLRETINSCLCDTYRLKFFREVHNEDVHKRAAFLMVWIVRIRPIQFIQGTFPSKKQDLFLNECYAFWVGLNIMGIDIDFIRKELPGYFESILYLFHNHALCPETLGSELFLLDRLAQKCNGKLT